MIKLLKFAFPLLIISFLGINIVQNWNDIASYFVQLKIYFFVPALIMLLLVYPQAAYAWAVLLSAFGHKVDGLSAVRVWIISNSSRYIPGTIWQYVGRAQLAKKELGINRKETVFTIIAEIYITLLAALCISVVILPFTNISIPFLGYLVLLSPLVLVFFHPAVVKKLINIIAKVTKRNIKQSNFRIPFKRLFTEVFPLLILNFFVNGIALYLLINSLTPMPNIANIFTYTAFYSLSWAIGFLSFFAPGGLGVTEVSLTFLLTPSLGFTLASAVALLYRVFLTVVELLTFMIFLKLPKKWIKQ